MRAEPEPNPVTIVHTPVRAGRTAAGLGAAVALFVGTCGLLFGLAAKLGDTLVVVPLCLTISACGLVDLLRMARFQMRAVRFSAEGVEVVGRVTLKRGEITHAAFIPARLGAPAKICLRGNGLIADVVVDSQESAQKLLRAAGLDTARVLRFFGVAPFFGPTGRRGIAIGALLLVLSIAAAAAGVPESLVAFLATVLLCFGVIALTPSEIRVGSDGVLVQNRFDATFYQREDILGAIATARGILLRLADRDVEIPMVSRRRPTEIEKDDKSTFLQAIADMCEGRGRSAVVGRLERADRPVVEWLGTLQETPASYRDGDIPSVVLHDVLTGDASASVRLAAAILLTRRGAAEDCEKVRIAADAVAEPKLRIALEAVASGVPMEDEKFHALVAELDPRAGEVRRRG